MSCRGREPRAGRLRQLALARPGRDPSHLLLLAPPLLPGRRVAGVSVGGAGVRAERRRVSRPDPRQQRPDDRGADEDRPRGVACDDSHIVLARRQLAQVHQRLHPLAGAADRERHARRVRRAGRAELAEGGVQADRSGSVVR